MYIFPTYQMKNHIKLVHADTCLIVLTLNEREISVDHSLALIREADYKPKNSSRKEERLSNTKETYLN